MNDINIKTWDETYSEGRSLLIWPDENVVSALNRIKGPIKKGIDIACGAGRHAILMGQMGIEAIGIDSSTASIKFAKNRAKDLGLKNVNFINGLAQNMDFENNVFDIAIMWGLIHYVDSEEQDKLIKKVWSILKPGGVLLCTLRSKQDSRAKTGKPIENDKFLVDYFKNGTEDIKKTAMYFWDEEGVRDKLEIFKHIILGHRIIEPIGKLGTKTAHWLVQAVK